MKSTKLLLFCACSFRGKENGQQAGGGAEPATAGVNHPAAGEKAVHVIDTHAHWYPREFIELLEKEAAHGAAMSRNAESEPVFSLPGISQVSAMAPDMAELGLAK